MAVEGGPDSHILSDPDEHVDRLGRIGDDHHNLVLGTDDRSYCDDHR